MTCPEFVETEGKGNKFWQMAALSHFVTFSNRLSGETKNGGLKASVFERDNGYPLLAVHELAMHAVFIVTGNVTGEFDIFHTFEMPDQFPRLPGLKKNAVGVFVFTL